MRQLMRVLERAETNDLTTVEMVRLELGLTEPDSTVDTVAAPMPPLTPPSRYGNLQAIAVRLDQLKTLYRSGQVNPQQVIAEIDSLISAAYNFPDEGERVNEVVGPLMDFKAQIEDFIQFQKSLEPIPAASSIRRGGTAYA